MLKMEVERNMSFSIFRQKFESSFVRVYTSRGEGVIAGNILVFEYNFPYCRNILMDDRDDSKPLLIQVIIIFFKYLPKLSNIIYIYDTFDLAIHGVSLYNNILFN